MLDVVSVVVLTGVALDGIAVDSDSEVVVRGWHDVAVQDVVAGIGLFHNRQVEWTTWCLLPHTYWLAEQEDLRD